ncbi:MULTISPECIES: sigma-70 family RNA polymerase sigma factor [unclassified Pseudomonas]|jgi:RNA polymerase sigma-70 factor (ECF subfamily)|uniref:sigma-70 family RNA polymerase sigma factor n=1 Tax=unclassified Pseudomonas TaxID=196821 RepID=UPI002A36DCAA|nr:MULTISPECIES: sigma-70 family RNA polymerase sigma factor [unclassified Pseudomonas]MDX9670561.1 sigma-70 family RNA polymerase sigma factor [Pseudomonas sp. P8_250]WPN35438.1 sigma-70 family RNA polymerase sigma factor [Pseudomonas sp. P8_139]WPN42760.1 sigma-70 family RNA polymerase sigma factor [Pseudomonas sp. P8_229]
MSGADPLHRHTVEGLFRAHYHWLRNYLRRQLQDPASAEDLTSETFVRLLEAPALTAIREPRALLTTIAQRLLYQHWRRADLARRHAQQVEAECAASPEELTQQRQTLNRLDRSLQRLPGKVRSTFLLARVDGLTYPQIAAELGISQRSVSVYMSRSQALCDRHSANQILTDKRSA